MAKKKYNNKSRFIKDWTTAKLKKEAKTLASLIYDAQCFGLRDLILEGQIWQELDKRGVKAHTEIVFDD